MKQSEKLKHLISCMKTTNELMRKQLDINQRCIELLGEFITEPEQVEAKTIKPEDMKAGEWYFIETSGNRFLIKFNWIHNDQIIYFKGWSFYTNWYLSGIPLCNITDIKSIRKATQKEILKYFPNELEVPTHGGNDAAYIQEVTDTQL